MKDTIAPKAATDVVRTRARGGAVRSLQQLGSTWVALHPIPQHACGADISTRQLPGLGLQCGTVWGNRHEHARADIRRGVDDFSIHMNLSGLSAVAGGGREMTLHAGDGVLLSYSQARTIARPGRVEHRIVRLPRASLAPLVCNIDDVVMRPIPRGTGTLNLLMNYVGALIDDPAIAVPKIRQLVIAQLCDLVAVTLGATRDAVAVAEGRGMRAARLRAIKDDIETHLTLGDLSPGVVAKRQRISESYIRKLFQSEDTSFSEFVLRRRLTRAHRLLTDPRWNAHNIASIAFEVGFDDVSYFNRTFKRAYGMRPSDVREKAAL